MQFEDLRINAEIFNKLNQIALVVLPDGTILNANKAACQTYGYTHEQFLHMHVGQIRNETNRDLLRAQLENATSSDINFETIHYKADGSSFPVEVRAIPLVHDNKQVILSIVTDVSEQTKIKSSLARVKELYKALYGVSQVIILHRDAKKAFNEACRVIVESGLLDMAWIGLLDPDGIHVKAIAAAGLGKEYAYSANIVLGDPTWGVGPAGTSITEKRMVLCDDILDAPHMAPWRESAIKYGFKAAISFPLIVEDEAVGALLFYSTKHEHFGDEEIELLDKLAGSLSLILHMSQQEEKRSAAEQSLRESERWLTESQKIAKIGHYLCDIVNDTWKGSEALYDLLGIDDAYDRSLDGWLNLVSDKDRPRLEEYYLNDVLGKREPFDIEYLVTRPSDRAERWVHGLGTVDYAEDGTPLRMYGIIQDIDQYKRALLALEKSERRYSILAEQGGAVVWEVDNTGLCTYISPVVETVLGYSPDEIINKKYFYEFYPKDQWEIMKGNVAGILADAAPFTNEETIAYTKAGQPVWLSTNGMPILDSEGNMIGFQGSHTDITIEKYHQSQLQELIKERESHLNRLAKSLESTVDVLVRVCEERDPYTAGHQRRVGELAEAIARELQLSDQEITDIALAGQIHDIGKISVPAEILTKPRTLSPIEFELVRAHAQTGYEVIKQADMPAPIADLVYQHHERCDGSGYPQKLKTEQILFGAKVLMVADVVEAMASHRPYRPALGITPALEEIELNSGSLYDKQVCEACLTLIREKRFTFSSE